MGFPRDTDCVSGCPGQVGERPGSRHQRPSPSETGIRLGSPPFAPRLLYPGAPGPLCLGGGKARQRGRPVWCYFGGSEVLTRQDPTPALARLSPGSGPCFANVGGGGSAWTCLGPTDPGVMDRLPHGPSCIRQLPKGRCLFLLSHQESGAQREGLGLQGAASRGSSRPGEEGCPGSVLTALHGGAPSWAALGPSVAGGLASLARSGLLLPLPFPFGCPFAQPFLPAAFTSR